MRNQSSFGSFSVTSVLGDDLLAFAFDTLSPLAAVGVDDALSFATFVTLHGRFRIALAVAVEVGRSVMREIVKGTMQRFEIHFVADGSDSVTAACAQIAERVIAVRIGRDDRGL